MHAGGSAAKNLALRSGRVGVTVPAYVVCRHLLVMRSAAVLCQRVLMTY